MEAAAFSITWASASQALERIRKVFAVTHPRWEPYARKPHGIDVRDPPREAWSGRPRRDCRPSLARVGPIIEASGGTIDKYIGDSVMAFWGAPDDQLDHARAACSAASEIAGEVETLNAARRPRPACLSHADRIAHGRRGGRQRRVCRPRGLYDHRTDREYSTEARTVRSGRWQATSRSSFSSLARPARLRVRGSRSSPARTLTWPVRSSCSYQ